MRAGQCFIVLEFESERDYDILILFKPSLSDPDQSEIVEQRKAKKVRNKKRQQNLWNPQSPWQTLPRPTSVQL